MESVQGKAVLQNSRYCMFALIMILSTGVPALAFGLAGMNPITPAINESYSEIYHERYNLPLPTNTWTLLLSLTMSMVFIGGFAGSLAANLIQKFLTRKQMLLILFSINFIGIAIVAIGFSAAKSYEMVICGRFIVGFSLGIGFGIFPLVINELCVPHQRPLYGAIYGTIMPFSAIIATFISWDKILGSNDIFLAAVLFPLIFPIAFAISAFWFPETPRTILMKSGEEEALRALQKLRTDSRTNHSKSNFEDGSLQFEMQTLSGPKEGSTVGTKSHNEITIKQILATSYYRKQFFNVVILFSLLTASGFANVLSFSDKIFRDAGLPDEVVTPATIGVYVVGTIASGAAILAMKRFDHKVLLLVSGILIAGTHILMTVSLQTNKEIPGMSWLSVAMTWTFMIAFSIFNTLVFSISGSLCSDKTRPLSILFGSAGFWFFGWLVGFMSPYLSDWIQGYAFLVWMAIAILGVIYIFICVPRTKGKTEEEIQAFYRN